MSRYKDFYASETHINLLQFFKVQNHISQQKTNQNCIAWMMLKFSSNNENAVFVCSKLNERTGFLVSLKIKTMMLPKHIARIFKTS